MSKTNYKQIAGLGFLIAGIAMVLFAMKSMRRIDEAKSDVETFTQPFSSNPIGGLIKKSLESKASQYDQEVQWLLYGGIGLIVIGVATVIIAKKR